MKEDFRLVGKVDMMRGDRRGKLNVGEDVYAFESENDFQPLRNCPYKTGLPADIAKIKVRNS